MTTAETINTTSRAAALCGTLTDMPTPAGSSPDARLIGLCSRLIALEAEFDALFGRRSTLAEEKATEPELDALDRRKDVLLAQIEAAGPPQTLAAIAAMARAGLAVHHYRDSNGTAIASDDGEWLLLTACEALVAHD